MPPKSTEVADAAAEFASGVIHGIADAFEREATNKPLWTARDVSKVLHGLADADALRKSFASALTAAEGHP